MHVKIGPETVINIGNLQDNTSNNVNQDPDPETNGLTSAQQSDVTRPTWIQNSPPSTNAGLPGVKVLMDGNGNTLQASQAIRNATATILKVFQGTGACTDPQITLCPFSQKIMGPDNAAIRCRILVNNKSIVKSLGDSIQEINTFAPNGGYVAGPWNNPAPPAAGVAGARRILPPQATIVQAVDNSLNGFRFGDCQDQPSGQRAAIATMYGDKINPRCISSYSVDGETSDKQQRWFKSVLAVRYDDPATFASALQAGGKANRKKTIRRRKQKKAKKSKYHDKKKKNTTLKKKRKATKKHISEKKKKNTRRK